VEALPTVADASVLEVSQEELKASILLFYSLLDEQQRRLYAGLESLRRRAEAVGEQGAQRDRAVIFGDGAGAFVLEANDTGDGRGFLGFEMRTDGGHWDKLYVPGGGSASFPYFSPEMFAQNRTIPVVEGRQVFRLATTAMPEIVREVVGRFGLSVEDLSLLLMHQANLRINESVQKTLGLPDEKVFNNIQVYGNTTAATLPLVYHEAKALGRVRPGDLVCFTALGAGLHWGAGLVRI